MRNTLFLTLSITTVAVLTGCAPAIAPQAAEQSPTSSPPTVEPTSTPTPSESFTAGAPDGQCLTANLAASVEEEGSSAGHLHYVVTFTNKGEACVLEGFPSIQVTDGGTPVGEASADEPNVNSAPVSLATGGTAVATLTTVDIGSGGGPLGDECTVVEGDALAITPPHSTIALPVAMPNFPACSNGIEWMTAGPVS